MPGFNHSHQSSERSNFKGNTNVHYRHKNPIDQTLLLREQYEVILSGTFLSWPSPMRQLGFPTAFYNQLELSESGLIVNDHWRVWNFKMHSVASVKALNFFTRLPTAASPYWERPKPAFSRRITGGMMFRHSCAPHLWRSVGRLAMDGGFSTC